MPFYKCCDCGDLKESKSDIEVHINIVHIGWLPYQCFYCSQKGVTTRQPNKLLLEDHVTKLHAGEEFTYLCTDNTQNEETLRDKLRRSILIQGPFGNAETPTPTRADETDATPSPSPAQTATPPMLLGLPIQPKIEVLDITDDNEVDVKPQIVKAQTTCHIDPIKCVLCGTEVQKESSSMHSHVKVHFRKSTGCVVNDLSDLSSDLKEIFTDLLTKSFPHLITSNDGIDKVSPPKVKFSPNPPEFICGICPKKYKHKLSLRNHEDQSDHYSTFENLAKIQCDICSKKFHFTQNLNKHKSDFHQEGQSPQASTSVIHSAFFCNFCDRRFRGQGPLTNHLKGCREKRKANLEIFQSGDTSKTADVKKQSYKCSTCKKKFAGLRILRNHMVRHGHDQDQNEVTSSDSDDTDSEDNSIHSKANEDFKCNYCDKVLRNSDALGAHKRWCTNRNLFKKKSPPQTQRYRPSKGQFHCPICSKSFDYRQSFFMHRARVHNLPVKWYCKGCKKELKTPHVPHILSEHLKRKQYQCSICEKDATTEDSISNHISKNHKYGKVITTCIRFKQEIDRLRNALIVDIGMEMVPEKCHHCNRNFCSKIKLNNHKLLVQKAAKMGKRNKFEVKLKSLASSWVARKRKERLSMEPKKRVLKERPEKFQKETQTKVKVETQEMETYFVRSRKPSGNISKGPIDIITLD